MLSPLVDSIEVLEQQFPISFSVDQFDLSGGEGMLLDDSYELFTLVYSPSLCMIR